MDCWPCFIVGIFVLIAVIRLGYELFVKGVI
jgi:hypothetical protein